MDEKQEIEQQRVEINKIAHAMYKGCYETCENCIYKKHCLEYELAQSLYNANYRNADDLIAKIKQLEEENYQLRQNLGQCENGYEQTLFLERCKAKDIEDKVRKDTIDKVLKIVKGLRLGFDNDMSDVFEETIDKIEELRFERK